MLSVDSSLIAAWAAAAVSTCAAGIAIWQARTAASQADSAQRQARVAEEQLDHICVCLGSLKDGKQVRTFTRMGQAKFRENPTFYLVEAEYYLDGKRSRTDLQRTARVIR